MIFRKTQRRGFTLTELAIVLGVAGLIVAATWVAAQSVWDNYHAYRASQQVGQVVQNIREYYMNAQGIPATAAAGCVDLTSTIDGLVSNNVNIFPSEMRRYCPASSGCVGNYAYMIDNPYNNQELSYPANFSGGSFRVCTTSSYINGGRASQFQIVLMDLPLSACVKLLMNGVDYNNADLGVTGICAGNESSSGRPCYDQTAANWANCANSTCTGITPATAQTLCQTTSPGGTAGSTSEVGWQFKLRN